MRYLAQREHGQAELVRKLTAAGHDVDVIRQVLVELVDEGVQSDDRYVEAFVRARIGKGYGPARIRQELHAKGVHGDAVARHLDRGDWDQVIERVYCKKYRDDEAVTMKDLAARARFLAQRGFAQQQIQTLFQRHHRRRPVDG